MIDNHNMAFRLMPSESKYCKPVMADDWLSPECLGEMVHAAEQNASVGLVCTYAFNGTHVVWDGISYPEGFVSGRDICRATLLGEPNIFGSSTAQLIRADLIRKRPSFYNTSNLQADFESCLEILQQSDFWFVHQSLTFNRIHENSVTSKVQGSEDFLFGDLIAIVKFGPRYLTQDEHEARLQSMFLYYYRVLAKNVLRLRGLRFWKAHRKNLQGLGYSLEKRALALAVLRELPRQYRLHQAIRQIAALIPAGASFILVDEEQWETSDSVNGRRRIPFLERNGQYWGNPEDDATAIRELERLRQSGAGHLVFAWPAFWWLEYYSVLRRHLESKFQCVLKNHNVIVYDVRRCLE